MEINGADVKLEETLMRTYDQLSRITGIYAPEQLQVTVTGSVDDELQALAAKLQPNDREDADARGNQGRSSGCPAPKRELEHTTCPMDVGAEEPAYVLVCEGCTTIYTKPPTMPESPSVRPRSRTGESAGPGGKRLVRR